jgi:hypothetical protein
MTIKESDASTEKREQTWVTWAGLKPAIPVSERSHSSILFRVKQSNGRAMMTLLSGLILERNESEFRGRAARMRIGYGDETKGNR